MSFESAYLCDMREFEFFLFEQHSIQQRMLGRGRHVNLDEARVRHLLREASEFAHEIGKEYQNADRQGCLIDSAGKIQLPESFARLWATYKEKWGMASAAQQNGDLPVLLLQAILEMFMGANPSFMTYGSFSHPASRLIERSGTARQKRLFLDKLQSLEWDACFCATEPDAGSDMTAIRLTGEPIPDEGDSQDTIYSIVGEKKYISAGMHELTGNTLYVALGQNTDDSSDAYRMSCFLVPRYWTDENGNLVDNNVECEKVESKMGFKACANTHLVFGRKGVTRGYVLGNRERVGLLQLVPLMQKARMSTGLFALGMASSAYLHALRYARKRVQGRRIDHAANMKTPRIAIIGHPDVQRMLLEMKSKVEGCRGLIGLLTYNASMAALLGDENVDLELSNRHAKLAQLYTPLVKAYVSDQAWRICELAIQVHGAVGYLADTPVEQYARDVKVLSIWEGTNYIQSQDLVRDKLRFGKNSQLFAYLKQDIEAFLARSAQHAQFAQEFAKLKQAFSTVEESLKAIAALVESGRMLAVGHLCTRFLEMMAETLSAWTLLDAACVADAALQGGLATPSDANFYRGKIAAARFFIRNVLPNVFTKADVIANASDTCIDVSSEEFGFLDPESSEDDGRPVPHATAHQDRHSDSEMESV